METVSIKLRKAIPDDLKVGPKTLRFGLPFWLKSPTTGKFDNNCQILSRDTDPIDIMMWLQNDMIYIPESSISTKTE